ncbi:MurR/RpiR family transcriptional regulator [uncultured Jannaschia sp.]|uniref:MurR/RpiR family transcriptional regulator n=1 Tax=uncultured Jannaschia sp. TaxID=293347 RepID=UPI0026112F8F|nr:MurR/RpiR family transcriptional regulator [uncultured Jannaschia sp.]
MDPTLKTRVISELRARAGDLSPQLRAAAKHILDNEADFGLDPIRETARKSGVSTYTLVRLSRLLGFGGFDDLREPFRHALVSIGPRAGAGDWLDRWRADGAEADVRAASNSLAVVSRSIERQSPDRLRAVVDTMIAARKVYVTAMRSSFGLAHHFTYVGRMALKSMEIVPRHMSSALDDLNDAGPEDVLVAITFTPYSQETIEAAAFAIARGVKLILISDSEIVAPGLRADHTILVSTDTTHHIACTSGAMAVLEILLAMLVDAGGATVRERVRSYDSLRRKHKAYWPEIKKR